jgi:hypothetical protein
MANNTPPPPCKTRIDDLVNQAMANLKKVTDAHPEDLALGLQSVKDNLDAMLKDNHHAN